MPHEGSTTIEQAYTHQAAEDRRVAALTTVTDHGPILEILVMHAVNAFHDWRQAWVTSWQRGLNPDERTEVAEAKVRLRTVRRILAEALAAHYRTDNLDDAQRSPDFLGADVIIRHRADNPLCTG